MLPIILAPMAGGPSTPALVLAVSGAGGLGSLALGYLTPEAAARQLDAVRDEHPIAVNLFAPPFARADPVAYAAYVRRLRAAGHETGEPRHDDDAYSDKLDLLCARAPHAVSFTFGCPSADAVARLRAAGSEVWVTVTSPEEARRAAHADRLIVQGAEAGGHRGTWEDRDDAPVTPLLDLLAEVRAASGLPLVAAGGIATAAHVDRALDAGAVAAAAGTAFLLAPEAGTSPAHRAALGAGRPTALTRAFSGRLARGIANDFLTQHSAHAPIAYPEIHHVTSPARRAARAEGDAELLNLWAGTNHHLAVARPAADTVRALAGS